MTDRDKQIIEETTKAVKDNLGAGCYVSDLLNIIISLQAENERLENKLDIVKRNLVETISLIENDIEIAKAEAYKEFAERLNELINFRACIGESHYELSVTMREVDNLYKELVGEQ